MQPYLQALVIAGNDNTGVIDREPDVAALRSLLATGKPRLELLSSRRRIGKPYLSTHALPGDQAFLLTAARTSPEIVQQQLLLELADDQRGLAEVASELNAAWKRRHPPRPILLVLAGSAVSTMEALASGGAPLYARFHSHHRLAPFDYIHAGELVELSCLEERRDIDASANEPIRYAVADSAIRFHQRFVEPKLSMLERTDPRLVWNVDPVGVELHFVHLEILKHAAHAGRKWAHGALDHVSPFLYVAAGGFEPEFREVAARSGHKVAAWDLGDLYGESRA